VVLLSLSNCRVTDHTIRPVAETLTSTKRNQVQDPGDTCALCGKEEKVALCAGLKGFVQSAPNLCHHRHVVPDEYR
jgi:hypothetical protein